MAITTYSSISTYVNTIFGDAVFVARERNLMSGLVTNWSARGWMTRTVPKWAQVTAAAATDGVDYNNPTTMSKSQQSTFTPGEIIAQALLTDAMMETDPDGAVRSVSFELGNAIATKIDVDLVGTFSSLTADVGPGAASSATIVDFGVGVSRLRAAYAPGPYAAVVHPYHWHDIWVELGQPAAHKALLGDTANQALRDFFVGSFMALNWYISGNISVDAGDDAISGIFSREAIALDTRRRPRMEDERDASLRATELNITAVYAYGTHRAEWGMYYTADAAAP